MTLGLILFTYFKMSSNVYDFLQTFSDTDFVTLLQTISLRSKRFRGAKSEETEFSAFCPREKWGQSKNKKEGVLLPILLSTHFSRGQNTKITVLRSFAPRKRLLRRLANDRRSHHLSIVFFFFAFVVV